jgi:predicted AlkP superfamily pyrophosphatase or phosphodiesterase
MGIDAPEQAASANEKLCSYLDETLSGKKVSRIFMYNPDAIAQWLYQKYPQMFAEAKQRTDLEVPFCTVMPSVTPVCFGTMYTGAQPSIHGIRKYEKPVITIDTLFDALLRAGKRVALVTYETCSLSKIYLEREMDYFHYDDMMKVNAKAAELILRDEHDFIVVYNGNYDAIMHKFGPESPEALSELRANSEVFAQFSVLIQEHWKDHDTLVGFAMDHGCHEIDGDCGAHGLDMPEDLNIVHRYQAYPKSR